ncbi:hypothetical protein SAMN05660473_04214 [Arthrobacter sp. 49Tsu3.1M3]|uniref:hypothetical protein n=1 Tax=Arthrobacter sp. 49Tsu3.1M3 TaxID=1279029 RepID=UPI0009A79324|nr:hypothetical protein [Arthrobacter sp. 49Tsu3.1M3]SKC11067.1 hypothetical protein SAMN05660473_04214 [Arthrobacter sp. 49Tsu3.1M3]
MTVVNMSTFTEFLVRQLPITIGGDRKPPGTHSNSQRLAQMRERSGDLRKAKDEARWRHRLAELPVYRGGNNWAGPQGLRVGA